MRYSTTPALASTLLLLVSACAEKPPEHSQLSEQPPATDQVATNLEPKQSRFSTRAKISYVDLAALAESEVPKEHKGDGKKKVCKKAIGLKLCGNARWQYTVQRQGDVKISGKEDFVVVSVPMRFFGDAGIRGDVAKLLKLDALDFSGAMDVQLSLKLDIAENWCPVINTDVQYAWTETPRLEWTGGIDMNLKSQIDKAIKKQMDGIQDRVANAIDCDEFRNSIKEQWRTHNIALDLPQAETMYLNVVPKGFSFSGVRTEEEKLGLAFALDAETTVQSTAIESEDPPLPAVQRAEYQPGTTHFNVLIRADYAQIQTLATEQIVGKTFSESSAAGDVAVTINTVDISGNPDGLTINLGFSANLPTSKHPTPGNVYLTAKPVVDAFTQTVRLEDIALSNVLDSTLWNTLAAVFNKKIIKEIEDKAVVKIGPRMQELASLLETQLSDPERTGGLLLTASSVNVYLDSLVPEADSLAAIVSVESQLDIDVPIQTIYASHAKKK